MLNGLDPYELPLREWQDDVDKWPETSLIDVTVYLFFSPSPFTQEESKNYKSIDCYQRFIVGWVRDILVLDVGYKRVLIDKVRKLVLHLCPLGYTHERAIQFSFVVSMPVSCFFSLVNVGNSTRAQQRGEDSLIPNPLSARMVSPGSKKVKGVLIWLSICHLLSHHNL